MGLYDVLPESYNMLTIQNSRDAAAYSGDGTVWDRTVPALHLEDDSWAAVAEHLIANALAIVSECLVLSPGVLAELQMIDRLRRHADTLLVLPEGILPTIDGDPLIQGFPNTVRGARLSDVSLTQIPFFARLIERSGSGTETDPTTTPSVPLTWCAGTGPADLYLTGTTIRRCDQRQRPLLRGEDDAPERARCFADHGPLP